MEMIFGIYYPLKWFDNQVISAKNVKEQAHWYFLFLLKFAEGEAVGDCNVVQNSALYFYGSI